MRAAGDEAPSLGATPLSWRRQLQRLLAAEPRGVELAASSTGRTMQRRDPRHSRSTPAVGIGRTTIGTSSCRALRPGQMYGYRVSRTVGPPPAGCASTRPRCSSIPMAESVVVPKSYSRKAACGETDTAATGLRLKSVVGGRFRVRTGRATFHCNGRRRGTIVYEMHVRGVHAAIPVRASRRKRRGDVCRRGGGEKIPYLAATGHHRRRAVCRVFQFGRPGNAPPRTGSTTGGYAADLVSFAPHHGYSSDQSPLAPIRTSSATW